MLVELDGAFTLKKPNTKATDSPVRPTSQKLQLLTWLMSTVPSYGDISFFTLNADVLLAGA